jgi:hypothetical protein
MRRVLRFVGQVVLYVAFGAAIGWFSRYPVYQVLPDDHALVRLSFSHGAQPKQPCRQRTAEELAKLAPNMRAAEVCARERSPVRVQVEMDGRPLYDIVAPPTGLAKDGAANVYRRLAVAAGTHRFVARLSDSPDGAFRYQREATIELPAGRALLIDFVASEGGFVFRH